MSESKVYFYPLWLRIWHGINALSIIILIITGFVMHYALHGSVVNFYHVVKIHNYTGVLLAISYIGFFSGNLLYGNNKHYSLKMKGWIQRIVKQAEYYAFGMFKGQQAPFPLSEKRKFNPLQKFSYFFSMYLFLPLVIISGIALLFPEIIVEEIYNINGVFITAVFHAGVGFLILLFLIVHVYAASIGKSPLQNYRSIITGWHELNH